MGRGESSPSASSFTPSRLRVLRGQSWIYPYAEKSQLWRVEAVRDDGVHLESYDPNRPGAAKEERVVSEFDLTRDGRLARNPY